MSFVVSPKGSVTVSVADPFFVVIGCAEFFV
jgi:hypothetical protein